MLFGSPGENLDVVGLLAALGVSAVVVGSVSSGVCPERQPVPPPDAGDR
jgi:hypothetical protein